MNWLKKQETHQLYAPTRRIKTVKTTVLKNPLSQIGVDLADMQNYESQGFKYLLCGIDLFSKFAVVVPLKNKTQASVNAGLKKLIKGFGGKIKSMRSDNGSEFISKSFRDILSQNNIKQVLSLPSKPWSNGQIEKFNHIIKTMIFKAMVATGNRKWNLFLPSLVSNYNNSWQETINMTPNEARKGKHNSEIESDIKRKRKVKQDSIKFKLGDKVRVKLHKKSKDGSRWSKKVYEISQVNKPTASTVQAPTYKIKGDSSIYYNNDLQKIIEVQNETDRPEFYTVSKIVEPKVQNGIQGYVIKWKGYNKTSDNTFEPRKNLLEDIPKMVRQYEKKHNIEWYDSGFKWNES